MESTQFVTLTTEDAAALRLARDLLEYPGLAARMTGIIGMPIEKALDLLPDRWADAVGVATRKSLETALSVALTTLDERPRVRSWDVGHKVAVAVTGASGGALGLAGLPLELPVSTTLMLRSIADVARSEGEHLGSPEARLACIEVFALGGSTDADDASESAYSRSGRPGPGGARGRRLRGAARRGRAGRPVLVRLVTQVASRFGGWCRRKSRRRRCR